MCWKGGIENLMWNFLKFTKIFWLFHQEKAQIDDLFISLDLNFARIRRRHFAFTFKCTQSFVTSDKCGYWKGSKISHFICLNSEMFVWGSDFHYQTPVYCGSYDVFFCSRLWWISSDKIKKKNIQKPLRNVTTIRFSCVKCTTNYNFNRSN